MMQNLLAVLGTGLVDPSTPILRADDEGVTRGDGCFEGIRVITVDGVATATKLERHLARMTRSAAALDIAYDPQEWQELVHLACAAWTGADEAAMKLVLTRGPAGQHRPTGYLMIFPIGADAPMQRRDGIAMITLPRGLSSEAFVSAPWLLGGVKTLSYAVNMAAQRTAAQHGAQDTVLVSSDGFVLEAPTASLVWANGRTLRTTPVGATGILAGTTQQLLFDEAADEGWDVGEDLVRVEQLHAADGLWSVSSVRGPVEVISLDGRPRERHPELDVLIKKWTGF